MTFLLDCTFSLSATPFPELVFRTFSETNFVIYIDFRTPKIHRDPKGLIIIVHTNHARNEESTKLVNGVSSPLSTKTTENLRISVFIEYGGKGKGTESK